MEVIHDLEASLCAVAEILKKDETQVHAFAPSDPPIKFQSFVKKMSESLGKELTFKQTKAPERNDESHEDTMKKQTEITNKPIFTVNTQKTSVANDTTVKFDVTTH